MAKGKKLFSFLEVTEETPIQKLTVTEQFRLLVRKLTNSDREQLRADDAETVFQLTLQANLLEFITKATERLRMGSERSVTMQISSKFLPVLDSVLRGPTIAPFYTCTVYKPDIDFDVDYFFKLRLEVKAY